LADNHSTTTSIDIITGDTASVRTSGDWIQFYAQDPAGGYGNSVEIIVETINTD
jgi:hypothetical protein